MEKINKIVLSFVFYLAVFTSISQAQILEPVKWSFEKEKISENEYFLICKATIEKKWHLYSQDVPPGGPLATFFEFDTSKYFTLIDEVIEFPDPIEEMDASFDMVVKYFANEAYFKQKIKVLSDKPFEITGFLEFMCCDDERCLPPEDVEFSFKINSKETEGAQTVALTNEANDELISSNVEKEKKSLIIFFFISFLAGLAAILTPCVFPMIPMTVTFFMKDKDNKGKGRLQASVYGISIIAIYTFIGSILAVVAGPGFANFLSTHWIPNVLFFLIFLFFAASFLGMFEIVLPNWMISKSDAQADRGGIVGAIFMAVTLVLVSFSCTGPIVGAILVESAGGQVLKPIIGMFGFSLAFALPFTLFAFFPAWLSNLPKSGGWLNSVKVVLGFLEIALGLKFLSIADQTYHWGILDREVYLAIWIVVFTRILFIRKTKILS